MKENSYIHLLQHKSFMAFWGSTTLLRLASNILQFALAIYVLDLTGSALVYSTVLSIIILPRILCSSCAGYLADRKDCIQILNYVTLGTTCLMACFFAIHQLLTPLNLPLIYVLVIFLEMCETFLGPTEGKILINIVSKEEISPASKISSLDDGFVDILSPIIASLFYSCLGLTGILGISLLLEGIALLLTFLIHPKSGYICVIDRSEKFEIFSLKNVAFSYKETFLCLKGQPYVIGIILFAPLFNFFISPLFSVTASHFFRVTMQANVGMYAMFNTVLGIAGLFAPFLAMIFIKNENEFKSNENGTIASILVLLCLNFTLYSKANIITYNGFLYIVATAMALLVVIVTMMNIATSITIKKRIPEQVIGRVISMIQLCSTISIPLGQLLYGFLADQFSITISYLISTLGLAITFIIMRKTYHMLLSIRREEEKC